MFIPHSVEKGFLLIFVHVCYQTQQHFSTRKHLNNVPFVLAILSAILSACTHKYAMHVRTIYTMLSTPYSHVGTYVPGQVCGGMCVRYTTLL